MVRAARKTPGNTRKQEAAERRITATLAQPASDGLDQDDREEWTRWRAWDETLLAAMDRLRALQEKCSKVAHRDWLLIRQAVGRAG